MIDKYDYSQKETVVRPQMEVNVQILDWLRFKADANMNYYYTKFEENNWVVDMQMKAVSILWGKPQKSRLPLAEHLLSISRYKI